MYQDWLTDIQGRFDDAFKDMKARHNYEYGVEIEVAMCRVLRTVLPGRAEVCRGSVIDRNGTIAKGDDLVVFDAAAFTPLRGLGHDLSVKQSVPAEAVLACIEIKHTLRLDGKGPTSLTKAFEQAIDVKSLERDRVPLEDLGWGVRFKGVDVARPKRYPECRNPWYSAIWARYVEPEDPELLNEFLHDHHEIGPMPDCVAAGSLFSMPGRVQQGKVRGVQVAAPFCAGAEKHATWCVPQTLARGTAHLLWAISWIRLGRMPWDYVIMEGMGSLPGITYV